MYVCFSGHPRPQLSTRPGSFQSTEQVITHLHDPHRGPRDGVRLDLGAGRLLCRLTHHTPEGHGARARLLLHLRHLPGGGTGKGDP